MRMLLLLCAACALMMAGCRERERAPEVRIAAAADLQPVMRALLDAFDERHPEVAVTVTYGSSGKLYAQLLNRAPFDVYLSADIDYAHRLADDLGAGTEPFQYAIGRLAVWTREAPEVRGFEALLVPGVRRVAIANPEHAPYGRAAVAALREAGLYEQVKDRLVHADNVAQAMQFVETGAAEAGILALSLVVGRHDGSARSWTVSADLHPPILQGGLVLPWARDQDAAAAFVLFLLSDEGRTILQRAGFDLPEVE
jgi:molybdate transport system substrate-binding protein